MTRDERRAFFVLAVLLLAGTAVRVGRVGNRPVRDLNSSFGDSTSPAAVAAESDELRRPLRPGETVDLDRASAAEMSRIPGIGPALAARILTRRERLGRVGGVAGLDAVSGIGPATLERIRPYVSFSRGETRGSGRASRGRGVDLNRANQLELQELPGIGPSRAEAIVEFRRHNGPFGRIEDLEAVSGIGSATVERLRAHVSVP